MSNQRQASALNFIIVSVLSNFLFHGDKNRIEKFLYNIVVVRKSVPELIEALEADTMEYGIGSWIQQIIATEDLSESPLSWDFVAEDFSEHFVKPLQTEMDKDLKKELAVFIAEIFDTWCEKFDVPKISDMVDPWEWGMKPQ